MKLNTKSRYAVMALADLAKFSSQNPVSLRDISLRQNISILYLEQIFLKLKKNNLVKSIRGTNGGYILNKDPKEIKLSEIFIAIDEKVNNSPNDDNALRIDKDGKRDGLGTNWYENGNKKLEGNVKDEKWDGWQMWQSKTNQNQLKKILVELQVVYSDWII